MVCVHTIADHHNLLNVNDLHTWRSSRPHQWGTPLDAATMVVILIQNTDNQQWYYIFNMFGALTYGCLLTDTNMSCAYSPNIKFRSHWDKISFSPSSNSMLEVD